MAEFTTEQIEKVMRAMGIIVDVITEFPKYFEHENLAATAGTNNKEWNKVKAGRLLHVTHMSAYNDTNSPTKLRLGFNNGHRDHWVKTGIAPLVSETVEFNGLIILGEGMYPKIRWEGATSGDDLFAIISGYWVELHKKL